MTTLDTSTDDAMLPVPVLVVEDEPLMQHRLLNVLAQLGYTLDAICVCDTLQTAKTHINEQPVALALIDLGLPDGNGIDLIALLRAQDPTLNILVISAWSTEDSILAALQAGATGYVLKERDDVEISLSIRSVLRGGAPIDPFIARRLLEMLPARQLHTAQPPEVASDPGDSVTYSLSTRETEILQLVAEGLTNREIAEQLFISRYTAECHIKHIYRKLTVSSRTRAVNVARQHGLLP